MSALTPLIWHSICWCFGTLTIINNKCAKSQFNTHHGVPYQVFIMIVRWWTSCETIKKLDNQSDIDLGGKQQWWFFICYSLSCPVINKSVNAPAASSKQSHRKPTLPPSYNVGRWILLFQGIPELSPSHPGLPKGCPTGSDDTNTWASDQHHLISWLQWDDLDEQQSLTLFTRRYNQSDGLWFLLIKTNHQ